MTAGFVYTGLGLGEHLNPFPINPAKHLHVTPAYLLTLHLALASQTSQGSTGGTVVIAVQTNPSPEKPASQVHTAFPFFTAQEAFASHPAVSHGFIFLQVAPLPSKPLLQVHTAAPATAAQDAFSSHPMNPSHGSTGAQESPVPTKP